MPSKRQERQPIKRTTVSRSPASALLPYKVLCILLFGRMRWISRHGGTVSVPVRNLSAYLKTTPDHIKSALLSLENWELVRAYHWHRTFVEIDLEVPVGMMMLLPAAVQLAAEQEAAMVALLTKDARVIDIERAEDPEHPLNRDSSGFDIEEEDHDH